MSGLSDGFIPAHGGYKKLLSHRKAEIVYDATVHFCDRFIDKRSRTHDQMIQAARSGKKNLLEGSKAGITSRETEIKLTNYLIDRQLRRWNDIADLVKTCRPCFQKAL